MYRILQVYCGVCVFGRNSLVAIKQLPCDSTTTVMVYYYRTVVSNAVSVAWYTPCDTHLLSVNTKYKYRILVKSVYRLCRPYCLSKHDRLSRFSGITFAICFVELYLPCMEKKSWEILIAVHLCCSKHILGITHDASRVHAGFYATSMVISCSFHPPYFKCVFQPYYFQVCFVTCRNAKGFLPYTNFKLLYRRKREPILKGFIKVCLFMLLSTYMYTI